MSQKRGKKGKEKKRRSVGAEPPQMEGVATSGVALQEPGSVQEPCASTSSGVQRL